ncbi:hypothetical protein [Methylorubrum sp. SB2]|uniref:hypothetical protein n=1 Tax=Methylorubrum subtropicum TaxID=3138812 RepID=UPI00313C856F
MLLKITAPMLLAAFVAAPALAQSGPMPGRPTLLVHGNYCGPGNNAPLAPVDALDAACARHDACTPDHGLPSKACNLRLEADAERVASDPRRPEDLRMMAGLVASVAAMLPARPADPATVVAAAPPRALARGRSYDAAPEEAP